MMDSGNQQQVVAAQPFETGIARMRLQGELSLGQPATQGLGINAKQTATVGQRQEGHGATPFVLLLTRTTAGRQTPGKVPGSIPARVAGNRPSQLRGRVPGKRDES